MDLRIAISFLVFGLSMNLIGMWAGVSSFDDRVDVDQIQNDLEFDNPQFVDSNDGSTFEAIQTGLTGFGQLFTEAFESIIAVTSLLKLAIPPVTGVFWFDTLVWMPIGFGILLGFANWSRGK